MNQYTGTAALYMEYMTGLFYLLDDQMLTFLGSSSPGESSSSILWARWIKKYDDDIITINSITTIIMII